MDRDNERGTGPSGRARLQDLCTRLHVLAFTAAAHIPPARARRREYEVRQHDRAGKVDAYGALRYILSRASRETRARSIGIQVRVGLGSLQQLAQRARRGGGGGRASLWRSAHRSRTISFAMAQTSTRPTCEERSC